MNFRAVCLAFMAALVLLNQGMVFGKLSSSPIWAPIEVQAEKREADKLVGERVGSWTIPTGNKWGGGGGPTNKMQAKLVVKKEGEKFLIAYWTAGCTDVKILSGWITPEEVIIKKNEEGHLEIVFRNSFCEDDAYGWGTLSFVLQLDGSVIGKNHHMITREIQMKPIS